MLYEKPIIIEDEIIIEDIMISSNNEPGVVDDEDPGNIGIK